MTEDPGETAGGETRAGTEAPEDGKRRKTDRFEKWLRERPLLGDADDPLFFLGICLVAIVSIAALLASLTLHHRHGHELRDVTFKVAGGILVALGAYTAVRTIISNRPNAASQTFTSLLALLAGDDRTADAARVGAIRHLPVLARRRGADTAAIEAVLEQLKYSDSAPAKKAADEARKEFPTADEQRAPDHGVRPRRS